MSDAEPSPAVAPSFSVTDRVMLAAGPLLGAVCNLFAWPTFHVWPLTFLATIFPVWAVRRRGVKAAFLVGWLYGVLLYMLGFTWIEHTLRVFAYMPSWMSWTGLFVLAVYHGFSQAAFLALAVLLKKWARVPWWVAVPVTYVPLEYFFPALFPWQLATPLLDAPALVQIADITGAAGVTFVVAMVSGGMCDLAEGIEQKDWSWAPRRGLIVAAAVLLFCVVYGIIRMRQMDALCKKAEQQGGAIVVGVVQPNIGIYEKEDKKKSEGHIERLKRLSKRVAAKGVELVVWPETAIQIPAERKDVDAEIRRGGVPSTKSPALPLSASLPAVPLIAGGFVDDQDADGKEISFNSAFLIRPGGGVMGVAQKNHLLMFGEYIPFEKTYPSLRRSFPHAGQLTPGPEPSVWNFRGRKLGMAICYEDLLTVFVRRLVLDGAEVIINITNDSWFGKSREPAQHQALAALRSVETRKVMLRVTNTGISAVIDPVGRIKHQTPIFKKATFVASLPLLSGRTFYVRAGPWLAWLCIFAVLVTLLQRLFQKD